MKKIIAFGASVLGAIGVAAVTAPAANADIVIGPSLPVVGKLVNIVIAGPLSLNWL